MSEPNVGSPIGGFPDGPGGTPSTDPCDVGIPAASLVDAAMAPLRMKNADQEVEERSAADLIALDKYLSVKKNNCVNGGNAFGGLKFGIIVPPSARGNQ